jgi:general secretion pathway protein J
MSTNRGSGFTLIELLVATALMAVLATLCWRGLESILGTRDRLSQTGDALRAQTLAFSQVDEDLRRSWPTRLLVPGTVPIKFARENETDPPALLILREIGSAADAVKLEWVAYRLNVNTLERGYSTFQNETSGVGPSLVSFKWVPILRGLESIQFNTWAGGSWQAAQIASGQPILGLTGVPSPPSAAPPVTGVELIAQTSGGEKFFRVFGVRD